MSTAENERREEDGAFDYLFKVVVIGDSSVGKSNLLSRFTKDEFFFETRPTIGVEFAARNVTINNKIIKIQIWDTAGQERFRAITDAYYRKAVGALLVYDITRTLAFENLKYWMDELYQNASKSTVVVLVGNKCDLEHQRTVSTEQGKEFAEKYGLGFLETSALESTNVDQAFQLLITGIYEQMARKSLSNNKIIAPTGKGQAIQMESTQRKSSNNSTTCC